MSKVKVVIFDVDGTLAETEEVHRQAFNDAFRQFDLPWEWDFQLYRELLQVTGGKERIAYYERDFLGQAVLGYEQVVEIHKWKTRRYEELIASGDVKLRPGVERLVREANDAGVSVAIATTTSYENIVALVDATLGQGGMELFQVIGAGDAVPHKKPAPDVYLKVLSDGAFRPADAVAIEDSRNGMLSSLTAQIPVVITPSRYTENENFDEAHAVVSNLGEPSSPSLLIAGRVALDRGYVDLQWLSDLLNL